MTYRPGPGLTEREASGAFPSILPPVGTYTLDSQSRVTTDVDGTTYTYDDAHGGRVAAITKNGVTRTAQYDTASNLTGWA